MAPMKCQCGGGEERGTEHCHVAGQVRGAALGADDRGEDCDAECRGKLPLRVVERRGAARVTR